MLREEEKSVEGEAEEAEKEDGEGGVALEGEEVAVGTVAEFGAGVAIGDGGRAVIEGEAIGDGDGVALVPVALAKVKVFVVEEIGGIKLGTSRKVGEIDNEATAADPIAGYPVLGLESIAVIYLLNLSPPGDKFSASKPKALVGGINGCPQNGEVGRLLEKMLKGL